MLNDTFWVEKYKPIPNHLDENAGFVYEEISQTGLLFETFGDELEYVQSVARETPERVWTLIEYDEDMEGNESEDFDEDGFVDKFGDTSLYIVAGYHTVNRLGYFITQIPAESETEEYIDEARPDTLEGSFTPDLVASKEWLCKVLEKLLSTKKPRNIYVLGSWYGNMGVFLEEAGIKYDKLILVEPDEERATISKGYCLIFTHRVD